MSFALEDLAFTAPVTITSGDASQSAHKGQDMKKLRHAEYLCTFFDDMGPSEIALMAEVLCLELTFEQQKKVLKAYDMKVSDHNISVDKKRKARDARNDERIKAVKAKLGSSKDVVVKTFGRTFGRIRSSKDALVNTFKNVKLSLSK